MRSSVSVILSNPPPDNSMSYPDYSTHPHHHQTLLIIVRQVGSQLKSRSFSKLYDRISRVNHIKVSDSNGTQRPVWVTYCKDYPVENNDWGDFQAHRRVLGIITIGQVESQNDFNDICRQHESLKVKYSTTLYDSRCIILGLNPDGSVYETLGSTEPSRNSSPEPLSEGSPPSVRDSTSASCVSHQKTGSGVSADRDSGVYESVCGDDKHINNFSHSHINGAHEDDVCISPHASHINGTSSDSGSESTSEGICGEDEIHKPNSHNLTQDSSHDTSHSSLSTGSQSSRLSLQPPSCFKTRAFFYPTTDHAVNIESQLQEFVSSLFWILESKRLDKSQEKLDKPPLLCAPFERKDFVGLDMDSRTNKKRCNGRLRKQLADLCLQVGLPIEAISHYNHAIEVFRSCNDWLWLAACYEGLCSASVIILYPHLRKGLGFQRFSSLGGGGSHGPYGPIGNRSRHCSVNTNSLPSNLDPVTAKQVSKYCLSPEDIADKYREAVVHYSKYRNAGFVETEASIKAVHVLIEQKQYLLAAEFLSNVIARFNALAELYRQIGFHRKSAFFRRVAAMRCAAPQNPNQDLAQCYHLLLQTIEGYKLTFDPVEFKKEGSRGWPALQIQILQEIVGTARRLNYHALCTRHQAFLLSTMLDFLASSERQEMGNMLEFLSAKSQTGPSPIAVQDLGIIIPPVNFINIPFCRNVSVTPPSASQKAEKKMQVSEESSGPFIFSPFASLMSTATKVPGKMGFNWVVGDVCEVCLEFENSLPIGIKISNLALLTEDVKFDCWSSTMILAPEDSPQTVTLHGKPLVPGELKLIGYSSSVLGVNSNCKFKFMEHLVISTYSINVIPALPLVKVLYEMMSLTGEKNVEECSTIHLSLVSGETRECNIVLHNVSSYPVEELDVIHESHLDKDILQDVLQFSVDNLKAQLPILPGGKASLTLYVYALGDFLCPCKSEDTIESSSMISGMCGEPHSLMSGGGPSSLQSRQSVNSFSVKGALSKRAESSMSHVSSRSGSSHKSGSSSGPTQPVTSSVRTRGIITSSFSTKIMEVQLKMQYAGGPGMKSEYFRTALVHINLEITPSLLVTRWDVLPAETSQDCYVVLDLLNSFSQEMDLCYSPTKHILIEAGDSCRVPVPVERCPLSKLNTQTSNGEEAPLTSEILGNHVASLIDLSWVLGSDETRGKASLKGITFPLYNHDLLAVSPIQWDVKVNGEETIGGGDNFSHVGEVIELSICLTNLSGRPLSSLLLRLTTFQDHQNGSYNFHLETKMATTGALKVTVPELSMNEVFCHKCLFVFFTAGLFKVEMSCSSVDSSQSSIYENILSPYQHVWKFAPPLELTVSNE